MAVLPVRGSASCAPPTRAAHWAPGPLYARLQRPGGQVSPCGRSPLGVPPVPWRPDPARAVQGADALAWLRGACDAATAGPPAAEAATFAAARAEAFPPAAANAYRHLRPHDFSDAVLALPQEEVQARARPAGARERVKGRYRVYGVG
jgi:hypothetical protein